MYTMMRRFAEKEFWWASRHRRSRQQSEFSHCKSWRRGEITIIIIVCKIINIPLSLLISGLLQLKSWASQPRMSIF